MSKEIRNSIFNLLEGSSGSGWLSYYYFLRSDNFWYKREINNAGGYFELSYSDDSGATWETLFTLDLTEPAVIIDLAHLYRHRIVDGEYRVDHTLTGTGYAGTEGVDWENLYTTSPYHVDLPQKLIVTPDVYTEEMDATTGWTAKAGATLELNITEVYSGTGSLKLTSESGVSAYIEKSVDWDLSGNNGNSFQFRIYPHTDINTTIESITVFLVSKDETWSHYFGVGQALDGVAVLTNSKWNIYNAPHSITTYEGTPIWSSIKKIRIQVTPKAGQVAVCSFDLVTAGGVNKPSICIMFDDINESVYTKAYPLMKAKGMVGTCYAVSDFIDTAGSLTSAQLIELNANKWDIGNHTKSHTNLTTLTQEQIETSLNDCKGVLNGLGLTRASSHVAYPFGAWNSTVIAAMTAWGAKTGRIINVYNGNREDDNAPYLLNCVSVGSTTTVNLAKLMIDMPLYRNAVVFLLFHDIVDSNADVSTKYLTSNFILLLDYIESLGLQTLTIDEYYRLNSGPITVRHR